MQRRFGLGHPRLEHRQLFFGQFAHVRIVQHRLRIGQIGTQLTVGRDLVDHRLQFGIFAAQCGDVIATAGLRHPGLDIFEALLDLL